MGGSRLRAFARKELGMPAPKKTRLQMLGHGLVWAGILVWVPYYYLKIVSNHPVDVMDYLPMHLVGVLGGTVVMVVSHFVDRKNDVDIQGSSG
jgi:hypothetical protein